MLWQRFPLLDPERMLSEFSRVFDVFDGPLGLRSMPRWTFPAVNLYDDNKDLVLTAELPGVKPEELELSVVENTLTLSGKRNGQGGEDVPYYRQERPAGSFTRTLTLPEKVDPDKVNAEYKDGILTVRMPKAEAGKTKTIAIKAA